MSPQKNNQLADLLKVYADSGKPVPSPGSRFGRYLVNTGLETPALRIGGKPIPVPPHDIHDQPDQSDQDEQRRKRQQQPDTAGKHHAGAVNHRSGGQIRIPGSNGNIAANRRPWSQVQIGAQRGHVTGDTPPRIKLHLSKQDRHVAPYIPMDVNRAEHARNITSGLPFVNRNVVANAGAVFSGAGKGRHRHGKKQCNSEEQSAHKDLVEQSLVPYQPDLIAHSSTLNATLKTPMSEQSSNHELPKAYDPSVIEERWAEYWVKERLFDIPTPKSTQDETTKFTILLPPPNVTGRLHMGHMLNQTEMDILTRWHRMLGDLAAWIPGTDHAGIATQMMVERQLATEGTSRKDLGREAFVQRVWCWRKLYGGAILDQMKRLGASVDWDREYFTMDDRLSVAVKEAFVRLYEQGLIYRGAYIVNWDPSIQTAVSDLEVEHEERLGKLYHIRYPLADGTGSIVVATTRPETMLGDTAIAVNPTDERYTALIGKKVRVPLTEINGNPAREISILADDWAKPEFGTGAVKVTPAHDPNDFAIGQRHNLPSPNILDETAHVALPGSPYHGLDRYAARERIVADLEAQGLLVAVKDHTNSIGLSQRTGVVIEPRLSMQWFLAVNKTPNTGGNSIAQNAIDAVESRNGEKHINFTPEMYKKIYLEWMTNIYDWCISRQLWWGHRIPAWHCKICSAITVAREPPTHCGTCNSTDIVQETDVLDTWFSSGLLPFTTLGWPGENQAVHQKESSFRPDPERAQRVEGGVEKSAVLPPELTPALAAFYPTTLLVTGFDILFFWVARMIMLGCHFMLDVPMPDGSKRQLADAVPFKEVYIHGLVRDADRQKMSKTKGNVINPIDIIERFGTDAVRFTLASMASPGTDIAFSEARTEGYRAFANKIWNAARFLFMNIDRAKQAGITIDLTALNPATNPGAPHLDSEMWAGAAQTPLETRWILTRLSQTSASVGNSLADYRFDEAANTIYQFFWGDLCDWYLEMIKFRLNFESSASPSDTVIVSEVKDPEAGSVTQNAKELSGTDRKATALTLASLTGVFEASLRLLSPFMPFITEEIWHALYNQQPPAKSIALTRYPQSADFPADAMSLAEMEVMQTVIISVRALRKELGVPEKEFVPIRIASRTDRIGHLKDNDELLPRLARVSQIEYVPSLSGPGTRSTADFDVAILYERQIDIPAERERLTKDLAKYEKGLSAAERQLGNETFMAKAPAPIVEGLRKQHAETKTLYDKTKSALEALGC
jgi:valyl-tRNA synthetase